LRRYENHFSRCDGDQRSILHRLAFGIDPKLSSSRVATTAQLGKAGATTVCHREIGFDQEKVDVAMSAKCQKQTFRTGIKTLPRRRSDQF
jgi:hypothetical protein